MKNVFYLLLAFAAVFATTTNNAQNLNGEQKATLILESQSMYEVPSIASQISNGTFLEAEEKPFEVNPKKWGKNIAVPGKGFPKGNDPLWEQQMAVNKTPGKAPSLVFEAASASVTPTDPTGAVGPNHFLNAWNSSFRIWDKAGNALTPSASLGTVLNGTLGDPIVMYDRYADRFFISEFYSNGFTVAVTQGPDPVNDGWYVYQWATSSFPDYPKYSIWSDGYYITSNKDQGSAGSSEVVFALERDAMLSGASSAQMVGFPLTNIVTSGFYSPLGFNCNGPTLPPTGNAPIVYMQDDVWSGVSTDHLKIWNINVNWTSPGSSTISTPQQINVTAFDGLFDGGSFSNLPQPSGSDIDALQATIMYMAQYRRFSGHNSVVFNFVVDLDGGDDYSGIRWYELRQTNDGDPWTIYQEGTYSQPGGHSAFGGNMCMDANGNIALAYTSVSTSLYPALRYTGRFASDPLGVMTIGEEVIANGTSSDPSSRYGDYSQMTIDPADDVTFWSIGEVFFGGRKNYVGVFQFSPPALTAEFSASPTEVCTGGSVTFTDQSLGSPTSWTWSFPGGSPSSYVGQNPPAISYSSAGSYNVTLTVGDGIDTDSQTKTGYITVNNVIADFIGIPTTVVVGNSVSFTDQSSCDPTGWSWSFPGGTPSSYVGQTPPAIQYDTEGSYDVTLTVTKGGSNDIETKTGYITVVPPEFNITNGTVTTCMGNFYDSGGPTGSYSNNETFVETFYPSTSGSMMRFNFSSFSIESGWDYLYIYNGENTSSPLMGTYTGSSSPGTVTASNTSGALTFRFTSDGSVTSSGWIASIECYNTNVPPVADFSASTTTPVINTDVVFTDQSSNIPTSWTWSFSPNTVIYINSTNSSSQNPEVQFTDFGLYSVTLEVSNAYGTDTEVKTDYINVGSCTHCSSSGSTGDEEWISNVTFNTINNSSVVGTGYTDYTSISTDVTPGSLYNASVTCGSIGTWTENIWIFVDWNQDCDFDDAGESYDLGSTTGPGSLNTDITIPNEAIAGPTLMRVSLKFSSDPTACESFSFGEVEDYTVNVQGTALEIALTAFLEGAYDALADQMGTDLNTAGHVPVTQPYNPSLPYYGNNNPVWMYAGSESVGTIPTGAVDWVVVQLRDATTASNATSGTIIGTQAGFLMNDGSIRGTDGLSNLLYEVTVTNNLYAVIYHRNHLGIMSANGLTESGGVYSYDFTSSSTQTYGGVNAVKELEPGVWGMVAADGDANGLIQNTDETSVWQTDLGSSGYKGGDYDMNGLTQNTDETGLWQPNLGGGGQIPAKGAAVMFKSWIPN
ncbi:MAG TPA: PKD domain-containing protein [Bacteroidales bacterium]|nr:PKD domain-containing protein [Bacteroidales bacterium]